MSTDTAALISIEKVVTDFLFGYKKSADDYPLYVRHACACFMDFNLYDGEILTTAKCTLNTTLKCIEMPDDLIKFIDLVTPIKGGWWSFTQKDTIVNTTTMVGGVETRDETQGEGAKQEVGRVLGYGAKGGYNKFSCTVDMAARRIYVDNVFDVDDYMVLMYVSSGIRATGETTVPAFIVPMIDAYLLEKETYWIPELVRERAMRHEQYWQEKMKVRNLINAMSKDQWLDIFYSGTTQVPQR
jgi:hypothetical protein